MDSPSVGKALRNALSRRQESVSYPCPNDNVLAGYLDGLLSPGEKLILEEHASRCGTCREVLGLALAVSTQEPVLKGETAKARPDLWWLRSPIAACAAAGVVLLMGTLLFRAAFRPSTRLEETRFSSLRASSHKADESRPAQQPLPEESRVEPSAARREALSKGKDAAVALRRSPQLRAGATRPPLPAPAAPDAGPADTAGGVVGGVVAGIVQPEAEKSAAESAPPARRTAYARQQDGRQAGVLRVDSAISADQAVQVLTQRGAHVFESRSVDGITFYVVGDYLIDGRCANRSGAQFAELAGGSPEVREVVAEIPGLPELMRDGTRVLLWRNGKVCILPPRP